MRVSHLALTAVSAVLLAACAAPERRTASVHSTMPPVLQQAIVDAEPAPVTAPAGLFERIIKLAPDLDPGVLALALEARACALRNGEVGDDARLAGSFLRLSDAEIALPADRPFDAAPVLGDTGDVLTELAFEVAGPGDELEAEPVVDHSEAARGER